MKTLILEKSTELFLNLGFKSVTMDDIASELGISKKTIYQHYANKSVLVEAVSYYLFDKICSGISAIHEENLNPIEELYRIKRFVMSNLKNEKSLPHYQMKRYYPRLFDHLMQKQLQVMHKSVLENLQRGVDQQIYRPDLDVEFTSRLYLMGMSGIKNFEIFPVDKFSMEYLTESYLEYHLRAIVTESGMDILRAIINDKN